MARSCRLTAQVQNEICAFIRQGSFPETAAEAAGVSRAEFRAWLDRSEAPGADTALRAFAAEVRKAAAQVRVLAEMETVKKNPLAWLKHGPGRETADMAGWTLPARPRTFRPATEALVQPELAELCVVLLRVLAPFPEARTAVAEVLAGLPSPQANREAPDHATMLASRQNEIRIEALDMAKEERSDGLPE